MVCTSFPFLLLVLARVIVIAVCLLADVRLSR